MIRLVADSGSTKTDWALIPIDAPVESFSTSGLNPALMGKEELRHALDLELKPKLEGRSLNEVFFYGAGCRQSVVPMLERVFSEVSGCKSVSINSDMLGAARGLCGSTPGVVCILGTGSNSCLYDGDAIIDNIPPLGYILGDEGSGASIGRRFLGDLFKRKYPQEIIDRFNQQAGLSLDEVIERVYRTPNPNRFLASMAVYVKKCTDCEAVESMVIDEFCRFIERNVAGYSERESLPVSFAGSIAYHFSSQLIQALKRCGCEIGIIKQRPIEGIIDYHKFKP